MKLLKLSVASLFFCMIVKSSHSQDSRVLIGLDGPAYGVKILSKFPNGTGGFARGYGIANQDNSANFIQLGTYGSYSGGVSTSTYSYIGREYNQTYMVFMPNGDIGIGTTTPKEKLSVNGNIRATGIKVETANWPDYVFSEQYRKPTLEEIESYIKENKHLPDVPKAGIVEKEGYSLEAMDKILLKKIEEMTLQMIELNKVVKRQSEEIKELKEKIKLAK